MIFRDYFASAESRSRCYFGLTDETDKYFEYGFIHIYGIPEGLSVEEEERIYSGGSDKTVYLGEITGTLILGTQMMADGEDMLLLCDDMSADLAYVASSFAAEGLIRHGLKVYYDIYYIYELEMEKEFDDTALKCEIIEKLPNILFGLYHVRPEYLAYYPLPLDSPDAKALVPKHNVTLSAPGAQEAKSSILVNDDHLDVLADSRSLFSPYPVSAKNRKLWELYESFGFGEVGKTRLLFKAV